MSDLKEDDYVYTDLGVEKVHYCEVNGEKEMVTPKGFILGDVPDFKKWNWIKLENIRVNMENAKLKQQLAIAVEQLKDTYVICFRNRDTLLHTPEHNIISGIERDCAIALQQIKELDK